MNEKEHTTYPEEMVLMLLGFCGGGAVTALFFALMQASAGNGWGYSTIGYAGIMVALLFVVRPLVYRTYDLGDRLEAEVLDS